MRPLVTIITPSLNQGRFIEATLRSVREQDYAPYEHRVYDGGSTDGTAEVLARWADRLHVHVGPDGGQAAAINRGLEEARGEVVAWLNSDDLYRPGAIATAVDYLVQHPDCAFVYGEAAYIDAAGRVIGRYPTGPVDGLREGCVICQPTVFMRQRAVAAVGYLDPALRYCMDYDLWLRLAARFPAGRVTAELAASRLHAGTKTLGEQLAFHREVVEMTTRRLGAAPLAWVYGYAELRVRRYLGAAAPQVLVAAGALGLSVALAARYHRRLDRGDLRAILARRRGRAGRSLPTVAGSADPAAARAADR